MRHGARIAAAVAVAALAGCGLGQSRLNPLNWFGSDTSVPAAAPRPIDARPVVGQVVSLEIAQSRSGAIISAVGLPPTQGYWEAELVPVPSADPSVLALDFRILPPPEPRRVGTQPSREVLAGLVLSTQELAPYRTIVVQGALNSRSITRR